MVEDEMAGRVLWGEDWKAYLHRMLAKTVETLSFSK